MPEAPPEIFARFIAAINAHDVDVLAALMAPNHLFVDSLGNRVQGAEPMKHGWPAYFAMCPDYRITIRHSIAQQDLVLATGEAGGTIHQTHWHTPAAWEAIIQNNLVAEWHVFADNKPVYEILQGPS